MTDSDDKSKDYEVGYGKPPKHGQIKPGEVRNPKGRPKGSKNMSTIMKDVMGRRVTIREGNRERQVSFREAFIHKLAAKSLEGSTRDMIALMKAMNDYLPETIEPDQIPTERFIRFIESDGNGRPKNPEDLLPITDFSKYRITDWRSGIGDQSDHITDEAKAAEIEEAWKASGIDDEP